MIKYTLTDTELEVLRVFKGDKGLELVSAQLAKKAQIPVGVVDIALTRLANENFLSAVRIEKTRKFSLTPKGYKRAGIQFTPSEA